MASSTQTTTSRSSELCPNDFVSQYHLIFSHRDTYPGKEPVGWMVFKVGWLKYGMRKGQTRRGLGIMCDCACG